MAGIIRGASAESRAHAQMVAERCARRDARLAARGPVADDASWAAAVQMERAALAGRNIHGIFRELRRVPEAAAALELGPTTRVVTRCRKPCVCQGLRS